MTDNARSRAGLIPPAALAPVLMVLFFLPWVGLSCNPRGATNGHRFQASGQFPTEWLKERTIARASGWDLACGNLCLEEDLKDGGSQFESDGAFPQSRPWAYFGLLLPFGVLVIAGMGLTGRLTPGGAGKVFLLLGLVGAGMMFAVTRVEYADDMVAQAEEQFSRGASFRCSSYRTSMAEAKREIGKVLVTAPFGWTWASLATYALISACGVACLAMDGPQTSTCAAPRRPERAFQSDVEKAIRRTAHPYVARAKQDDLPDLGPDLFGEPEPAAQGACEEPPGQSST